MRVVIGLLRRAAARLRRWGVRRRTDRTLTRIAAKHQRIEQQILARLRLDAAIRLGTDPQTFERGLSRPPARASRVRPRRPGAGHLAMVRAERGPPHACCADHDNGIVTACDGITDTVVCGVCRARFQRPCPDGPIRIPD